MTIFLLIAKQELVSKAPGYERSAPEKQSAGQAIAWGAAHAARVGATRRASVTKAALSGVIGSRAGTTRPMVWTASGSTMGMARIVSVRPSVSASFAGITLAQRPVRTCENRTIIELDSSIGSGGPPA